MTHLRLWRFDVPAEIEPQFVAAYGPDGDWALLFSRAPGFISTQLWHSDDGSYLTADNWRSLADFERFQQDHGEEYRRLDAALEGLAGEERFIGAFELVR